jgi:hypothetical protein
MREIPATSGESGAFSRDLKHRGFSFVGPTVVCAYMQAVGMVNDHLHRLFPISRDSAAGLLTSGVPDLPARPYGAASDLAVGEPEKLVWEKHEPRRFRTGWSQCRSDR